ncbi:MAG: hypothetical protein M1548_03440 [Actinobacteria bacterium]|nr:hypothetical protein [Actinomycetota bacterium]
MRRVGMILLLVVIMALAALFPLQALAQPYVPAAGEGAAITGEAAAPSAPGAFPITGGDLLLLSMGVGIALTAAGFGGKYLMHKRGD